MPRLSATRLPVATLPVKMTLSTSDSIREPPTGPVPMRTCIKLESSPAARSSLCSSRPMSGVNSDGLRTTALPIARADKVSVAGMEKG